MSRRLREPGELCWINMLTADTDASCRFYAAVLGWTYVEMPGMGWRVQVEGRDIGGLFDLHGPGTPPGTRAQIGVMIKVANADATVTRIKELGGTATPAWDIGGAGRMSVCGDPTGAKFDLWEPKAMPGFDADPRAPGAPGWFELMTTDAERAARFYDALLGWSREETANPRVAYSVFKQGQHSIGGMLQLTPGMGAAKPDWTTYLTVADADAAVAAATSHHAEITMALHEAPNGDRFARITSPQGVPFGIIQFGQRTN